MTQLADQILEAGLDDWVPLLALDVWVRKSAATSDGQRRQLVLATIRELVEQGLSTVGSVSSEGFRESRITLDEALARIDTEWRAQESQHWGFAVWLRNTDKGNTYARLMGLR